MGCISAVLSPEFVLKVPSDLHELVLRKSDVCENNVPGSISGVKARGGSSSGPG